MPLGRSAGPNVAIFSKWQQDNFGQPPHSSPHACENVLHAYRRTPKADVVQRTASPIAWLPMRCGWGFLLSVHAILSENHPQPDNRNCNGKKIPVPPVWKMEHGLHNMTTFETCTNGLDRLLGVARASWNDHTRLVRALDNATWQPAMQSPSRI